MVFFNTSSAIGIIIASATTDITGSLFLTMLLFVLSIFAVMFLFNIPMEFSVLIVLPTILSLMANMGEFIALGGVLLIYISILVVRMFFIN